MVLDKIESLIDSLAFNANLNSISAILWQGARQEVNFPLNILPLKKDDLEEDQLYTVNILNWIFRFLQRSLTDITVHS